MFGSRMSTEDVAELLSMFGFDANGVNRQTNSSSNILDDFYEKYVSKQTETKPETKHQATPRTVSAEELKDLRNMKASYTSLLSKFEAIKTELHQTNLLVDSLKKDKEYLITENKRYSSYIDELEEKLDDVGDSDTNRKLAIAIGLLYAVSMVESIEQIKAMDIPSFLKEIKK